MAEKITAKTAMEIISHEAIVREAYRDSRNIWTWSIGITSSSGHKVYPRYVDNPQTLKRCFEVFEWLLREKYLPLVLKTFKGFKLTEEQLAGALSFHYNTGGIKRALWVKEWKRGEIDKASKSFLNWKNPPEIIARREKERDLFFDGKWSSNGRAVEYKVNKPSYKPDWDSCKVVEIKEILEELFD